jgi:hypothetical protein
MTEGQVYVTMLNGRWAIAVRRSVRDIPISMVSERTYRWRWTANRNVRRIARMTGWTKKL